jgi:hypothetical protein
MNDAEAASIGGLFHLMPASRRSFLIKTCLKPSNPSAQRSLTRLRDTRSASLKKMDATCADLIERWPAIKPPPVEPITQKNGPSAGSN